MNIIAGMHDVRLALETRPESVVEIFLDERRKDKRAEYIANLARKRGVKIHRVNREELEQQAGGVRHQGVVALGRGEVATAKPELNTLIQSLDHDPLVLVLDGVQDPHNLGACLRSADAAGVDAVVVPADRACGITPVVSKVAAGAVNQVPLFTVTNLGRCLDDLKELGLWIIGTSDDAQDDLWQTDFQGPCAIVLGAEEKGMRPLTRKSCDYLVRIPMAGVVESLNVSVATGVLLYECRRQRISGTRK